MFSADELPGGTPMPFRVPGLDQPGRNLTQAERVARLRELHHDIPLPAGRMHPADQPHAGRLREFRRTHPGVLVFQDDYGHWQAVIREEDAEIVLSGLTLAELLGKLAAEFPDDG